MALKPPPQPNPAIEIGKHYAAEFFDQIALKTKTQVEQLISDNAALGGDPAGYAYHGRLFSLLNVTRDDAVLIPVIDVSLEPMAEMLFLKSRKLDEMTTKLSQALTTLYQRTSSDGQTFRDALPEALVKETTLSAYARRRPEGFLLKAYPLLAATYRILDEAITYRQLYHLLD